MAVLTRSHYKQFNAQQLESLADSEALGGDVGGGTVRKSPLTIERRLAALERAIEFHHDKELASADQAAPASAAASISEVKTTEEGLASMTNASLDHAAAVRWWTRGMLLASFVECGGDWRKTTAKLCGSGSKRNASDNKATAEIRARGALRSSGTGLVRSRPRTDNGANHGPEPVHTPYIPRAYPVHTRTYPVHTPYIPRTYPVHTEGGVPYIGYIRYKADVTSDTIQIQYRYNTDTIPIQYRYKADIKPI